MLALLLALTSTTADAGTLRATLAVDDDGTIRVVRATEEEGEIPATDGTVEVLTQDGRVVRTGALPPLATHRSVITPDGDETVRVESPYLRVRLPWPDDAAGLRFTDDGPLVPIEARKALAPGVATPVLLTGASSNRLDLVFFAEGYPEGAESKFDDDVDAVVDALLSVQPWRSYTSLFNIWKVYLTSPERGIDRTEGGDEVDSVFECFYGCGLAGQATGRLICCDEEALLGTVDSLTPFADGVMVLVNETTYGGSGGLTYSTSYTGDELALQVAVHELGHTLIGLWDEYGYGIQGDPAITYLSPNCSPVNEPVSWGPWLDGQPIDWARWQEIQTGKATPGTARDYRNVACDGRDGALAPDFVCAYPTCSFTDWVRPTQSGCMMNRLGVGYCDVCREGVIKAFYRGLGSMVQGADPPVGERIRLGEGETLQFLVDAIGPDEGLQWDWSIDGYTLDDTPDFVLDGDDKVCGDLTLRLTDPSTWVRNDPEGLLSQEFTWDVKTAPCCGCAAATPSPGVAALLLLPLAALRRRRR